MSRREEVAAVGAGPDPQAGLAPAPRPAQHGDGARGPADTEPLSARVTALEDEVRALRGELTALREELG